MEKYLFTDEKRSAIEELTTPFAIYQFLNKRVVTLVLSDGFCELFGYKDKEQAYHDMDNDMYRYTHPDDVVRIANEAFRFATDGGKYEVLYRTRTKDDPNYKVVHAMGRHIFTEDGVRLAHVWYTDEGTYAEDLGLNEAELNKSMSNVLHKETLLACRSWKDRNRKKRRSLCYAVSRPERYEVF